MQSVVTIFLQLSVVHTFCFPRFMGNPSCHSQSAPNLVFLVAYYRMRGQKPNHSRLLCVLYPV